MHSVLTRRRVQRRKLRATSERACELCSRAVGADHQHLIEPATRRLLCVCDACAVLFPGGHAKYKRVPRTIRFLPDFRITDAQWDSLLIPIEMAFFYDSSHAGRIVARLSEPGRRHRIAAAARDLAGHRARQPGAGPDGSPTSKRWWPTGWDQVVASDAATRPEYYILPIDECFKLVGLIRLHWKGLSGGTEVWREIARFFADVRTRASRTHEVVRA